MATNLAVNDICQIVPHCWADNQLGLSVLHCRVSQLLLPPFTDADLAMSVSADLKPIYAALLASNAIYIGVQVRKILPAPAAAPVTFADPLGGSAAGDALPKQVSGLLSIRTGVTWKGGHGRIYVPFPAEADSGGLGSPSPNYQTRLDALGAFYATFHDYSKILGGPAAATIVMGVLRRVINNQPLIPPTFVPATGGTSNSRWATQRRRGDFGRTNIRPF